MAAPAKASAAAVAMAGAKPSLNAFADPSPPWAVKTAVVIAIPKAPPSWRTVLNVPEAAPIAAIGTAPMTALCAFPPWSWTRSSRNGGELLYRAGW